MRLCSEAGVCGWSLNGRSAALWLSAGLYRGDRGQVEAPLPHPAGLTSGWRLHRRRQRAFRRLGLGFGRGLYTIPSSFMPVRVGEIDRVVGAVVILAGRINDRHAVLVDERAERVDVLTAGKLKRIMMKADVALAVLA